MPCYHQKFKDFAFLEMQVRPTVIRQWANQTEDQELRELAEKVIEAAQG